MISILIPVFNRDVNELVHDLSNQVALLHLEAEIIVMDDGSETSYRNLHSKLSEVPFVRSIDSDRNNGRIRIRQMLAETASYEWLLFLDCDSKIVSDQFLKNYYQQISGSVNVIMGGRIYAAEKPVDCRFMLHWKYGTNREKTRVGMQEHTNRFMTNNFLIRKDVFAKFNFAAGWKAYGYEDTWMSIQLEEMNMPVIFIDNPVQHEGLETSSMFLVKSEEALANLKRLSKIIPENILVRHVKLYHYFCLLRSWKMLWLVRVKYFFLKKIISKSLHSCSPSLVLFDLYRLYYFMQLKEEHKALS